MEKEIKITECDVCGKTKKESYYTLHNYHGWHKYIFCKDWQDGCHRGFTDVQIIVCEKCNETKNGVKYFFHKILKPFVKSYNKDCAVSSPAETTPNYRTTDNRHLNNK